MLLALAKWFLAFPVPWWWILLSPIFGAPIILALRGEFAWYTEAGLWVLGIFLGLIGHGLLQGAQEGSQRGRDGRAQQLLESCRRGDGQEPFVLYLRGFAWDGRLTTQDMSPHALGSYPTHIDFETILERAIAHVGPLVSLGRHEELAGAGRVQSGEQWQLDVATLAARATQIVIVPANSPGTLWELEWLKTNARLDACIVVMPMSPTQSLSYAGEWLQVSNEVNKYGIHLPAYDSGGAVLRFQNDGRVAKSARLAAIFVTVQGIKHAIDQVTSP
ncbi:MAG TPA: hypothetical protein VJN18_19905 [Polyangiaceae bacterium]|nr:hypothetical protein [Polyangiaceae bacterium]